MKHRATIRSKFQLMVLMFLFIPFFANSVKLPAIYDGIHGHSINTKSHHHAKQETQLVFGFEKESEGKTKTVGNHSIFISILLNAFSAQIAAGLQITHSRRHAWIVKPPAHIPLYLSKRTLIV